MKEGRKEVRKERRLRGMIEEWMEEKRLKWSRKREKEKRDKCVIRWKKRECGGKKEWRHREKGRGKEVMD